VKSGGYWGGVSLFDQNPNTSGSNSICNSLIFQWADWHFLCKSIHQVGRNILKHTLEADYEIYCPLYHLVRTQTNYLRKSSMSAVEKILLYAADFAAQLVLGLLIAGLCFVAQISYASETKGRVFQGFDPECKTPARVIASTDTSVRVRAGRYRYSVPRRMLAESPKAGEEVLVPVRNRLVKRLCAH
jgi:hypothetical protein